MKNRVMHALCVLTMAGCSVSTRTSYLLPDGSVSDKPVTVERQLTVIQLPPNSPNMLVQNADGGYFRIGIPGTGMNVIEVGTGGVSNLSAPANSDVEIAGDADLGGEGYIIGAKRLIRGNQYKEK